MARAKAKKPRKCGPSDSGGEEREAQTRLPPSSSGASAKSGKKPSESDAAPAESATRPKINLGVDPKKIDEAIRELRAQVARWVKRGVADKVRISYKGKPLAPDIPVYYFLAAEALTFWATGFLRILIVNLGAKAFLEIEFISSAEEHHAEGMKSYLAGDMDSAISAFAAGVAADDYHAPSHLMLGVCRKVKGDWTTARRHFQRAAELDDKGDIGAKAREHLRGMSRRLEPGPSDDAE